MWKAGALDGTTALQLLGRETGATTPSSDVVNPKPPPHEPVLENPESKKRPLEKSDVEPDQNESLDELLEQADKNRKESQPYKMFFLSPGLM